nr:zinc ribbon domain-containing protein [Saccharomonospora viridis]
MVTYSYRCRQCGDFDVRVSMGEAEGVWACPWCGASAVRRFTAPQVRCGGDVAVRRAYEYAERSAEQPEVVSAPPPARAPRVSRDPRHARLPRP